MERLQRTVHQELYSLVLKRPFFEEKIVFFCFFLFAVFFFLQINTKRKEKKKTLAVRGPNNFASVLFFSCSSITFKNLKKIILFARI